MKNIFRTYHKFKIRVEFNADGYKIITSLLITSFTPLYLFKKTKVMERFGEIFYTPKFVDKYADILQAYKTINPIKKSQGKSYKLKTVEITYREYNP